MKSLVLRFDSLLLHFLGQKNEVVDSLSEPFKSILIKRNCVFVTLLVSCVVMVKHVVVLLRMDQVFSSRNHHLNSLNWVLISQEGVVINCSFRQDIHYFSQLLGFVDVSLSVQLHLVNIRAELADSVHKHGVVFKWLVVDSSEYKPISQ